MAAPFEIMATPFDVYLAPVETAFPDVDVAPGAGWDLLGTNGAAHYAEDGVTATHEQNVEIFRGLRGTGPVKAFRTSEGLTFGFTLHDMSLEQYAKVLNDATTTAAAGPPATISLPLHQGPQVATFAVLIRSADGPYGDGLAVQYQVPKAFQSANPAPVHRKGQPAGLAIVFTALEDLEAATDAERFGQLVAQTA